MFLHYTLHTFTALIQNFSGLQTSIEIGAEEKVIVIDKTDLKYFAFLRFKNLWILYDGGSISIDEKLQLIQCQLKLFETALSDLEKITLIAAINRNDQSRIRDHSQLLDHLGGQVLPICHSSAYHFFIDFQSDNDAAGNVVGQILQLVSINRCREVYFHYKNETFIQLPVDAISNWLNRNSNDQIDSAGRGNKAHLLLMDRLIRIQNAVAMCDHLKMVIYLFLTFKIPKSDPNFTKH